MTKTTECVHNQCLARYACQNETNHLQCLSKSHIIGQDPSFGKPGRLGYSKVGRSIVVPAVGGPFPQLCGIIRAGLREPRFLFRL